MKINLSSRALCDGDENLTHNLTETTKSFLAVPQCVTPIRPREGGATATAKAPWRCYGGKSELNAVAG